MKISRWIYVPLFTSIAFVLWMSLVYPNASFEMVFYWLIGGAAMGFLINYASQTRAREVSKDKDERAFDVYQNRNFVVLTGYETAFNLCRDAVLSLKRGKIKAEDFQDGTINAINRTMFFKRSFWGRIDFQLRKINDNLTEIEFSISPVLKTTLVSYGDSWEIAEQLSNYITEKDAEINKKVLADSIGIMEDVYVKPFQKEKVGK